jgi:F-box interacting protein
VVAGCDDYRMIDKTGATSSYIPPWSTSESSVKIRRITQVSNSCNGIMLINHDNSFFLFNPATKYFQKVLQLNCYQKEESYDTKFGLYYDPAIDDYKALVLFRKNHGVYVGGLASLKGKHWTKIDSPVKLSLDVARAPVLNGRLHWVAMLPKSESTNKRNSIVCFNPMLNVFETFPSPPTPRGPENNCVLGMVVMDGCLWFTRWKNGDTHLREEIEVFKMKEYGVPESWTLMYVISHVNITISCSDMTPLLTMENGHILFSKSWAEETNHGEILEFNPETNWCIPHSVTPKWNPYSVPFVKNLDSPIGYYWDPIDHEHFGHLDGFE